MKIDWFDEMEFESRFFGTPEIVLRAEASERDRLDWPLFLSSQYDVVTASIWQSDVTHEHIDFSRADDVYSAAYVIRSQNLMTEMGEQTRQHVSRVPMVFHEQDPQWLCQMFRSASSLISFFGCLWQRIERYLERGAETATTAVRFYCATVKLHKMSGDRETQSESAKLPGHRSIGLLEWLKQLSQSLAFNSNPVVGNFEMEAAWVVVERPDADLSAGRRELHSIGNQIPKHLLEPDAVAKDVMLFRIQFGR